MVRLGLILTIVGAGAFGYMYLVPDSKQTVLERLNEAGIYPESIKLNYKDNKSINIREVGNKNLPVLLLIHGSPGDWSAWENIITNERIRQSYYIIAIDRAGFGATPVPALPKLQDHADVVWSALEQLDISGGITIAAHSYGGAVAEQLLIDHPNAFIHAVLAAPTLSPDLAAPRWYNKFAKWKFINQLLSKDLKASNIEMLGLPESLQQNEAKIASIKTPITYIQGMEDVLVPFETVDYFKRVRPDGVKYIIREDMNHFIPWSDPDLINDALLENTRTN